MLRPARNAVRHVALEALTAVERLRSSRRNAIQVLYFHDVTPADESHFRTLIENLRRTHRFLSYSEALRRIHQGPIDDQYLTVSFDDGLKSCVRAARILNDLGVSACFFICDLMADSPDEAKRKWFCEERLLMPVADFMTWSDMERLLREDHEIGNHSSGHRDLRLLSRDELEDDVGASLRRIRQHLGNEVQHFAWPYGEWQHMNREVFEFVYRTGHASCASAQRGAHVVPALGRESEVCVRRHHVLAHWPERHVRYFISRYSRTATEADNYYPS